MKKIFISFIICLFFPLFALEWGGLIGESLKFNTEKYESLDDVYTRQSNSISLWSRIPFVNSGDIYLTVQGTYKYYYDFKGFNHNVHIQDNVDLDLFKLNGMFSIKDVGFSFSLGRYFVMDSTSKVLAQNCDGISLNMATQNVNVGLYAGYTGLINGNNVITLAKDGSKQYYPQNLYGKTNPYIPLSASITFPSVIFNQSLAFHVNSFLDIGPDKYNRLYGTLCLQGPIYDYLYYQLNSCFSIQENYDIGNLSKLSIMVLYQALLIKLNCEYASGNQLCFKPFKGFNSSMAYNSPNCPEYAGLLLPGLDFIFSLKDFYVGLNGKFVILYPENELEIHGISVGLDSITNIYSDLSFDFGIQYFADFTQLKESYLAFSLGLSLSF